MYDSACVSARGWLFNSWAKSWRICMLALVLWQEGSFESKNCVAWGVLKTSTGIREGVEPVRRVAMSASRDVMSVLPWGKDEVMGESARVVVGVAQ